ncbi:hypothetical protein HOC37_02245 [bacterium]|jgi:hypothetical protein|nr:hypothetical protein [bacterium]MBT3580709.1 hypothetical protein [bacterium]MBT4551789.1 hypothetical protein [bacterium]MBT5988692.1 hypothetical protein [bacterium]MBT7087948.1 hypothetical protein [bacterium]
MVSIENLENHLKNLSQKTITVLLEICIAYQDSVLSMTEKVVETTYYFNVYKINDCPPELGNAIQIIEKYKPFNFYSEGTDKKFVYIIVSPSPKPAVLDDDFLDFFEQIKKFSSNSTSNNQKTSKNEITLSLDFYSVNISISETLTKRQATVLKYMHKQHKNGVPEIKQEDILNHINQIEENKTIKNSNKKYTPATRLSDIFKTTINNRTKTHPLFYLLIDHNNKGFYFLNSQYFNF